jgi:hypothetical protein
MSHGNLNRRLDRLSASAEPAREPKTLDQFWAEMNARHRPGEPPIPCPETAEEIHELQLWLMAQDRESDAWRRD